MKTYTVIPFLLLLLLLLAYQCSQAQDYVITTRGDTLKGDVKHLSYGVEKKVQVNTSDKKKNVLSILQVREFRLKDEIYQPVRSDKSYVFMKVVRQGYLTLYAFQQENQAAFDGLFLLKRDGARLELPNLSFKKIMTRFLEDCPSVSEKISAGEYGKKEILTIIDEYNKCVGERTSKRSENIASNASEISAWTTLETKVKDRSDLSEKESVLEMISEVKSKRSRNEKVPNFMIDALKKSLDSTDLKTDLETALKELGDAQ